MLDYKEVKQILDEIKNKIIEDFELADSFLQGLFARRKFEQEEVSKKFKLIVNKKNEKGTKTSGVFN